MGPIEAAMPFVVSPYRNNIFHWLAVCRFFVQVTKAFGKQWKAWPLLLVNILNAASLARIQSTYDGPQKQPTLLPHVVAEITFMR